LILSLSQFLIMFQLLHKPALSTCGEWLFEGGEWHFPKDFNFIDY
jgi:hypothetical protein